MELTVCLCGYFWQVGELLGGYTAPGSTDIDPQSVRDAYASWFNFSVRAGALDVVRPSPTGPGIPQKSSIRMLNE